MNSNSDSIKAKYEQSQQKCNELIKTYELKHEENIITNCDLGKFYKFVNSKLSRPRGIGALMGLGWDKVKRWGSLACSDF